MCLTVLEEEDQLQAISKSSKLVRGDSKVCQDDLKPRRSSPEYTTP